MTDPHDAFRSYANAVPDITPTIEETCSERRTVELRVPIAGPLCSEIALAGFVEVTVNSVRRNRGEWDEPWLSLDGLPVSPRDWPAVREAIDRAFAEYAARFTVGIVAAIADPPVLKLHHLAAEGFAAAAEQLELVIQSAFGMQSRRLDVASVGAVALLLHGDPKWYLACFGHNGLESLPRAWHERLQEYAPWLIRTLAAAGRSPA